MSYTSIACTIVGRYSNHYPCVSMILYLGSTLPCGKFSVATDCNELIQYIVLNSISFIIVFFVGCVKYRSNTIQSVEKTFQLSRYDRELLQRTDYDLQVKFCSLNFLTFIDLVALLKDINVSTYLKVLISPFFCSVAGVVYAY